MDKDTDTEIALLRRMCKDASQIIGHLAETSDCLESEGVVKALENLDAASQGTQPPHDDMLAFFATEPKKPYSHTLFRKF